MGTRSRKTVTLRLIMVPVTFVWLACWGCQPQSPDAATGNATSSGKTPAVAVSPGVHNIGKNDH